MAYIQKHNYKGVFKMTQDKMTEAEVRAKYDRTAPKPKPVDDASPNARPAVLPGINRADRAKTLTKQYGDVMDKEGKPILNPLKLLTSNKFNYPRWEGRMMDAAVEGVKNAVIPGRFLNKMRRAYKYNKITKNKY
jgi:hypothetical protein|tara:strand:- start:121 stop:525 length:405 start_codon:yes stop_codon:yes gene_type:complete